MAEPLEVTEDRVDEATMRLVRIQDVWETAARVGVEDTGLLLAIAASPPPSRLPGFLGVAPRPAPRHFAELTGKHAWLLGLRGGPPRGSRPSVPPSRSAS